LTRKAQTTVFNAKERYFCDVDAEFPAKLDDNYAYCHHPVDRRFDMD